MKIPWSACSFLPAATAVLALSFQAAVLPEALSASTSTVLAGKGDPAPGANPGEDFRFDEFDDLAVNGNGAVLFWGSGSGALANDPRATWMASPALSLVARNLQAISPGFRFSSNSIFTGALNNAGRIGLATRIQPTFPVPGADLQALLAKDGNAYTVIADETEIPNGFASEFSVFNEVLIAGNGDLVYAATLADFSTRGLWLRDIGGNNTNLIATGDAIDIAPQGTTLAPGGAIRLLGIADQPSVLVAVSVQGGPFGFPARAYVRIPAFGPNAMVAAGGRPAPGFPGFSFAGSMRAGTIQPNGNTLVGALIENGGAFQVVVFQGNGEAALQPLLTVDQIIGVSPTTTFSEIYGLWSGPAGRLFVRVETGAPGSEVLAAQNANGKLVALASTGEALASAGGRTIAEFRTGVSAVDTSGNFHTIVDFSDGFSAVMRFTLNEQAPTVKIRGKRRQKTRRARVTIRGTAADDLGIESVEIRVNRKPFRLATGTTRWRFKTRLKKNRNTRIFARATDLEGFVSPNARITIRRTSRR